MSKKTDQKLRVRNIDMDLVLGGGMTTEAFRRWFYSLPPDPTNAGKSTLGLRLMQRCAEKKR